jgi:hypothetical protein
MTRSGSHRHEIRAPEDADCRQVVETIYCPRHGQRVPVVFETSRGLFSVRTDVASCPLRAGNSCDLTCLSPVGGTVFG